MIENLDNVKQPLCVGDRVAFFNNRSGSVQIGIIILQKARYLKIVNELHMDTYLKDPLEPNDLYKYSTLLSEYIMAIEVHYTNVIKI